MKRPRFYGWHYSHLLVQYISLRELKKVFPSFLSGTVIDIGCGEKPYRDYIAPFAKKYYGIDFPGTLHPKTHIDVFSTACPLPFKDRSVDAVLMTAVLEHLEEPVEAAKEFARVLRQGGCVIATVPLFWQLHEEPRDFYRYTSFGIKHIFDKAGFSLELIKPLSGFCVTFGQQLAYMVLRFNKGPMRFFPVLPLIAMVIQAGCLLLDTIDRSERWTWAYLLVARKK